MDDHGAMDNPLLAHLGVELRRCGAGEAEFALTIDARHRNRHGRLHGGVIATMLDVACGYAGIAPGGGALTVALNIAYVANAGAGEVVARGRVVGGGRSLFFAAGEVLGPDGDLLATAQGTFKRTRGDAGDGRDNT